MRAVTLGKPADRNLRPRIRPGKRRQQHAHLRVVQVQIALHRVRRRGQVAAIHVIDEQQHRHQDDDGTAGGPRRIERR
jgi:hypothetical protein